jgi:hypothetical protein
MSRLSLSKGQQRFLNGILVPKIRLHFTVINSELADFTHAEWKEYLWNRFGSPCGDCAIQAIVDWCDELDITIDNP